MGTRSERIVALIGEIYEAGIEPARWETVLARVCDEIGAIGGLLGYYEPKVSTGHTAAFARLDPNLLELFHSVYVDNPWTRSVSRHCRDGRAVFLDSFVPRRELNKTQFYTDILQPQRIESSIVVNFLGDERGVGGISYMYGETAADSNSVLDLANLISGHIRRAIELGDRLNAASLRREAAEEAIDQLRRGVLTLDERGTVRFMNEAARRIIAARDGLTVEKGRLRAQDSAADRKLGELTSRGLGLLDGRITEAGGVLLVQRPSARRPYLIMIAPFRSDTFWPPAARPAALCFITDSEAEHRVSAQMLAELFALTPTEARIALAIAGGGSLPLAARAHGIRLTTARTHLQRIFDKTGVRSQTALAQLITHIVHGLPIDDA